MHLLLDTHALIWIIGQDTPSSLGPQAVSIISGADKVFASSVSIVEIRIKTMLGKFISGPELLEDIAAANIEFMSYSAQAAEAIQKFPQLIRHDPFDRMLLGQASSENVKLMTSDPVLLELGLDFVINAKV